MRRLSATVRGGVHRQARAGRAALRAARWAGRPGRSPSSRPRPARSRCASRSPSTPVDVGEAAHDPVVGLGKQRRAIGAVDDADLMAERTCLLEQPELRARPAGEDERLRPFYAGAAARKDSSSRRMPSSSGTSGRQPSARIRSIEIARHHAAGRRLDFLDQLVRRAGQLAGEPGDVGERDGSAVGADVEGTLAAGLEHEPDRPHDVTDPAERARFAAEERESARRASACRSIVGSAPFACARRRGPARKGSQAAGRRGPQARRARRPARPRASSARRSSRAPAGVSSSAATADP